MFDDATEERSAADIRGKDGAAASKGFIEGTVHMSWPWNGNDKRIQLQLSDALGGEKRLDIRFSGLCAAKLAAEGLKFTVGQKLRLSLHEAECQEKAVSSIPSVLNVTLKYDLGVALQILGADGQVGRSFSTLLGKEVHAVQPAASVCGGRYSSRVKPVDAVSILKASLTSVQRLPGTRKPPTTSGDGKENIQPAAAAAGGGSGGGAETPQARTRFSVVLPGYVSVAALVDTEKGRSRSFIAVVSAAKGIVRANSGTGGKFLEPFLGVGRLTKRRKDLMCNLWLVDPSHAPHSNRAPYDGFRLSCFAKKYKEWLPASKPGDVLILRDVKVAVSADGARGGTGYRDKLRWWRYDVSSNIRGHGDLDGKPRSEGVDDGHGVQFSPFYEATPTESAYCDSLRNWWFDLVGARNGLQGTEVGRAKKQRREHMLICDVIPTMENGGFFDCTVEVHQAFENGLTWSLFVTDYTPITNGQSVQKVWCPVSLADRMLRVELWDGARTMGPKIKTGELYSLKNVRMVTNRDGYPEGKMNEPKMERLDAAGQGEGPLQALLGRKQRHEVKPEVVVHHDVRLLAEGLPGRHITCVVEVLQVDEQVIYVTDYSRHEKFGPVNKPWAQGLDGCVLKVALDDEQQDILQSVEPGRYYQLLHLRLESSHPQGLLMARLGGPGRLTRPLKAKGSALQEWKVGLVGRKNAMKQNGSHPLEATVSIREMLRCTGCPGGFLVRAKVADFFPFDIRDAFVALCGQCKESLPIPQIKASPCDVAGHEREVAESVLRISISDGEEEVKLSVSGKIPALRGFVPRVLQGDTEGEKEFIALMQPLLNNLVQVHEAMIKGEVVEFSPPLITLEVDSWRGPQNTVVYGLVSFRRSEVQT
ncbi:hypothetical protein C8R43DRAFT_1118508 [Mycena crocata]|nr:hypothetical protein C8R43DRAFT_1118508 [Mycena crocata]